MIGVKIIYCLVLKFKMKPATALDAGYFRQITCAIYPS